MAGDWQSQRGNVRVLVLTGLGLNCEQETSQAFALCGAKVDKVHLNDVLDSRGPGALGDYHILALIGGFSFGDHLGAGTVFANRIECRLKGSLEQFLAQEGLVLGVCNGFQTMVRLGLLPGLRGSEEKTATLSSNEPLGYYDGWVRLKADPLSPCLWTQGIAELELPSRHGEGRFLTSRAEVLTELMQSHQVALYYADEAGKPAQAWPDNPNGSPGAVAGICDPSGRLFGLMPHPDAYLYGIHHPQWPVRKLRGTLKAEGDGIQIFRNGVDFVAKKLALAAGH